MSKAFSSHKNTPNNISDDGSAVPQYTLFPRDKKELKLMVEYIPSIHDHKTIQCHTIHCAALFINTCNQT